ncbi:MAG: SxtJ family membrane protein [Rhodospirillales bacterium]|jgi:hypothetical protein
MMPPRQADRAFGLTMAGALTILSGIVWFLTDSIPDGLLIAAAVFLATGLLIPALLLPLNRLWRTFSMRLGIISNFLILGSFFFLVVFPTGLILRFYRRDPMRRKVAIQAATYWAPVDRQTNAETLGDMF